MRIAARCAALAAALLWAGTARAADAPFAVGAPLAGRAVFGCSGVTLADASVGSDGVATWTAKQGLGHVGSNGDVVLSGRTTVQGDVVAGPGRRAIVPPESKVTGLTSVARDAADCRPVDLAVFDAFQSRNDNARIPKTAAGRNAVKDGALVLDGPDPLTLPAGTYVFSAIALSGRAHVLFSGEAHVFVTGDVSLTGNSHMNPAGGGFRLRLVSAGARVSLDTLSTLSAFVYAPGAAVTFATESRLVGSVFADSVVVRESSVAIRTVDDTPPVLDLVEPVEDAAVSLAAVHVRGTVRDPETAVSSFEVNGVTAAVAADGSFDVTVDATATREVRADATNAAGLAATLRRALCTGAPSVAIRLPANGSVVASRTGSVVGTCGSASTVTVNGVPASVSGGAFQADGIDFGPDGLATVTVVASNACASSTAASAFVVDTVAPVLAIDSPAPGSVFGASPISVTGTFVEANLVDISVNGVAAAITGNRFTATVPIPPGASTLVAVARDVAGRSGRSAEVAVSLDAGSPNVRITSPASGSLTGTATATVSGVAEVPNLAGVRVAGIAATLAGTSFTVTGVPLSEGDNRLVAEAVDSGSRSFLSAAVVVTLDTLPPSVALETAGLPALTNQTSLAVSGTVSDPHLAGVTVNGVAAVVSGGRFTATAVPLVEGDNVLRAHATDTLGHAADSNTASVNRDTLAPVLAITSPATNAQIAASSVTVAGTVADAHLGGVTVNGVAAAVANGQFAATLTLPEGDTSIVARATDAAGNAGASPGVPVTVDTLPPVLTIDAPADPLTGSAFVTVTGTVVEPHLLSLTVAGAPASVSGGKWVAMNVPLVEGTQQIKAVAVDTFGHRAESASVEYRLDSTPPVLTMDAPAPDSAACRAPAAPVTVSGRVYGRGGARPTVTLVAQPSGGTAQSFTATLDAAGTTWTVPAVDLGSGDGTATLTASTTDALGHDVRVLRSFRIKASTPSLALLLDGGAMPGAAPGSAAGPGETPVLFGRALSPRVAVSDGPGSAPPAPVVTLDGAPWSGAPISAEATHLLAATVTDCAGHTASAHALFTIDVTPPRLLTFTPADGASLGAAVTSVSGTSDPDLAAATVNGGTASVSGGAFSLSPFSSKEGANTAAIVLTDRAGNRSTFVRSFNVKSIGPSVEILESGAPLGIGARFFRAVTPTVRSNDAAASITATLNGGPFVSGTTVGTSGDYTLSATATDTLGHSSSASASFKVDLSSGPAVDITAPADRAVLPGPTVAVTGTASASVTSVSVNGRAATLTGATWSLPDLVLPFDVPSEIVAIAADGAGRTASATRQVTVRASGPQILILEPADGAKTNRKKIDLAGAVVGGPSATANGKVTAAGQVLTLDALGTFRAKDVALLSGANTLTASATDPLGRTGTASVTVTTDTTAPGISISADSQPLAEGASFARPFTLRVTITDDSTPLPIPTIRLNGSDKGATAAVTDLSIAQAGGYVVSVVARDAAGNESRADRSFVLASGGCAVSALDPGDGAVVAAPKVTLKGRSGDAASVTVTSGGQTFGAQLADGTFAAGDVPLSAVGKNTLSVACADRAGTVSTANLSITRLADGAGPVVHIVQPVGGARQRGATVAVTGTVSDSAAAVTVNGVKATVASGGFSAGPLPLVEGPNVLAARAVDAAGRSGEDRVVVFRDSAAPKIAITSPPDGAHVGKPGAGAAVVSVSGVVDLSNEPNLASVVVSTGAGSVTATVDADTGAFYASGVPLVTTSPGAPQAVTATATDTLAQSGTATVNVVYDSAGPALVLAQPVDGTRFSETSPSSFAASGEAWAKDGAIVSINGGGLDGLAWDAPAADGRRHATFTAQVTVPATEGPFGVIARVEEPSGAYANDKRLLFKDTTAPTVVDMQPADGAKQVDANEIPLVLFSETVRPSSLSAADGLTLTRVSTGEKAVGTFTVAGSAVAFAPGAAMVRGEAYTFRAGIGITDLVGHPLAAAKEARFTIAAVGAGAAPALDPVPPVVCAQQIVISGSAAPSAAVRLRDGSLSVTGNADSAGRFAITLALSGNGWHEVHAAVIDSGGAAGPDAAVLFRVDCSAPSVAAATFDRGSGTITVSFTEAMKAASLTVGGAGSAITVSKADDATNAPQAATLSLSADGLTATLALGGGPSAWWSGLSVRLSVGPPAADAGGNVMAAPYATVFFAGGGGDLSGGFLSGAVLDEESGRPLSSADVKLYASGAVLPGAAPPALVTPPTASTVTDGRGRFSLTGDIAAGRYALVLSRTGYTRSVRRLALEPSVGSVPFGSRLTPLAAQAAALLAPASGGSFAGPSGSSATVDFAPNALVSATDLGVRLTPLSGQGLPEPLPLGWTPLAAAELRLIPNGAGDDALPEGAGTPFTAGGVTLTLPLPAGINQADLYAARYDVVAGAWLALPLPVFVAGSGSTPDRARVALAGPGSVAIIAPDANPATRPPVLPVSLDAPLVGVNLPSPVPTLTATIALDPPVVSPTGRATARVVAKASDGTTPWPAGLAVQGYLDEKLILSDGGELYEAPFSADLVLYHPPLSAGDLGGTVPGAAGALTFRVSPSPRAAQVLLDTGYENVRLFPFTDQLERGQVLGPAGGSVTTADGIELVVPESGLAQKTVVSARTLTAAELALLPPVAGYSTIAAVRVSLSGAALARPATLKLNAPAGLPADAADDPRYVLASFVDAPDDGRGAFANAVSRVTLLPAAGAVPAKLIAAPEASGSPLPFPGLVVEGLFLYLHASAPVGFVTGRVTAPNGAGIAGSRVTAAGLGTANLSVPGGVYAVPAPAGAPTLSALHPTLGVAGSGQVPSLAKGQVATLDLVLTPVPPTIRALQPPNGAADQPVGSTVSVAFNAALDPASVTAATLSVSLADATTGAPTGLLFNGTVALSPDRTTVVFTPARPLPPGRRIAARFTGGVRDVAGTLYGGALPVDWSFTTSTQFATGGGIHPEEIQLLVPVGGVAQIVGADGALPLVTGGTTPWSVWADIDGPVVCPSKVTQPANGAGGFTLAAGCPPTVSVTIASKVYIHILDPTGTEAATFRLGPFATPDGKGFVANPGDDTVFTSVEGVEVTAPAGAFDVPTLIKVTKQPLDSLAVALNPGLEMAAVVNVDFDGTAKETLRLRIPVATASPVGGLAFAGTPIDLPWGRKLQILDVGRLVDDGKGGKLISTLEADQPEDPALVATSGSTSVTAGSGRQTLAGRRAQALPKKLLRAILLEMTVRGDLAFVLGATVELSAMTGSIMPALVGTNFLVLYSSLADAMVFAAITADARYVLPSIPGKSFQLIARDTATGWILNSADYGPVNPDTSRFYDLKTFPDGRGPIPLRIVDAYPFRLYPFRAPEDGQNLSLEVQLEARGSSTSTSLGVLTPAFPKGTSLDLFNLKHAASSEALGDLSTLVSVASTPGDELLAIVGPADLEPDTFLTRPLSLNFNLQAQVADADLPFAAQLTDCGPIDPFSGCGGRPAIPLSAKLTAANRTLELVPPGLLPRGHVFLLVPDKARIKFLGTDGAVVDWPKDLPQSFWLATRSAPPVPNPEVSSFSSLGDTNAARDLLKFGNILLVGSATGNLLAVDVSRTADALSTPAPFAFLAPSAASQIRAFATDGHNRLFVNELLGASWAVKAIRVEDAWAASPANCTGPPATDWRAGLGCFAAADGGVKIAFALGSSEGISPSEYLSLAGSLPTGTPTGMQVLVDDQTVPDDGSTWEIADFVSRFAPEAKPDADGFFDFEANVQKVRGVLPQPLDTVCNDNPYYRFQRVSVDNLSTGQIFSADVPVASEATVPHVRGRAGDRLRVRFNRKALAYVAIVGSGISVVDLNRFYDRPDLVATQANKSQCGRRIARYEAADIPIYANAYVPADATEAAKTPQLDGLSNTPALAVGVDTDIRVDSVLTHYGAVHATSPQVSPEALGIAPFASPNEWRTPTDSVRYLKDLLPHGVSPAYRDVLFAPSVAWIDRGIESAIGGVFRNGTSACAKTPCENKKGRLLFYSLGMGGVGVFDVSRGDRPLVGRFKAKNHTVFRLAIDPTGRRLFAGGTDDKNNTIIDVWDIARANGGPTQDGLDSSPVPEPDTDPRLLFSLVAPWDTNHLGFDETGDGLVYTWGSKTVAGGGPATTGGFALPYDDLSFTFAGVYRDPSSPPSSGGQPGIPVVRPSAALRPLGVPSRTTAADERTNSDNDELVFTPAFKLRISLPGALAPVLKARVQSLRSLPDRSLLDQVDIGAAPAPPGGKGWPDPSVVVTLRRLGTEAVTSGDTKAATGGRLSTAYNLYESDEVVVLVADPRAAEGYRDTLKSDQDDSAGEGAACRRCRLPSYLDPKRLKLKDLLAAGPYLRAHLFVDKTVVDPDTQRAIDWFEARKDAYPAPRGTIPVDAWADSVPSAAQVTLAEPSLNPATWQGEAGVRVALGPGEALFGTTDFATAGRGVDFSFDRSYRSGALGYGPLGAAGWSANLFAHLRFIPPIVSSAPEDPKKLYSYLGEAQYYDGSGRVFKFYPVCTTDCPPGYALPSGATDGPQCPADTELDLAGSNGSSYCVQKGAYLSLQQLENGRAYRIVSRTHGQLYFNADGSLAEVSDRFRREPKDSMKRENTLRLSYDGTHQLVTAEDDYGRRYTFEYERDAEKPKYGLLKSVKDFGTGGAQRHVDYEFDSATPETRLLKTVHLPEVDALQPGQSDPATVKPDFAYEYVSSPPAAPAPLHDPLGNARLKSVTLPQFLDSTVPRFTIDYDSSTGRVKTITVPNTKGAPSLRYSFDPTILAASHPFLAESVTVTPPWSRAKKYSLSPEGRVTTLEDVTGVPTFVAPAPAAGFPSPNLTASSKTPKTNWTYETDGKLKSVVAPDGGTTTLSYERTGGRFERATPSKIVRTAGDAAGLSTTSSTVITTDWQDNQPRELSVEMEAGSFHKLLLDVPPDPPAPSDPPDKTVDANVGWVDDGQKIVVHYDKFGQRQGSDGAGVTGAPKVVEKYLDGEDPDKTKNAGFPDQTTLGDSVNTKNEKFDDDHRGNPTQVSTTNGGAITEYKYDAWDRVKSSSVIGNVNTIFRTVPAQAEQAFDAAGHLVRERHKQNGEWVEARYSYDAREQLVKITRTGAASPSPGGAPRDVTAVQNDWDTPTGLLASVTRGQGSGGDVPVITLYDYEPGTGRVAATREEGGGKTSGVRRVLYDAMDRPVYRTDGDKGATWTEYDGLGRVFREALATGAYVERKFDAMDHTVEQLVYDFGDDGKGGTQKRTLAKTTTTFYPYGPNTSTTFLTTDELSKKTTTYFYDGIGRVTSVITGGTANGVPAAPRTERTVTYKGNAGLVDTETDAAGNVTTYKSYVSGSVMPEAIERLEKPDGVTATEAYQYDAMGRVVDLVAADGTHTALTYDEAGNLKDHSVGSVTRHFGYDGWGNVTAALGPAAGAQSLFGFDALGRVLKKQITGAGRIDETTFTYDELGRLATRTRPQSAMEVFAYDPDGMLNLWTTRFSAGGKAQLQIGFDYDPANRLVRRRVVNANDYRDNPPAGFRLTDDADVTEFADGLSRLSRAAYVTGSGSGVGTGAVDAATAVTFTGYDLRGLPAGESTGSLGAGLGRQYDVWGNATRIDLPSLVSAVRSYNRAFDDLDRLTRADAIDAGGPISGFGMTWGWAGVGRLTTASSLGPASLTHAFTYPGASPVRLSSLALSGGGSAYGSFSYDWEFDSDFKKARRAIVAAQRFVSGLGWTWTRDEGRRLASASSTPGDWTYLYGPADEFTQVVDSNAGTSDLPTSGPEGRLEKKGTTTYAYDAEGRRIEDARFLYTWDFRSRLVRAESKQPATLGEVVDYAYDALGRLLTRTHRGALPSGSLDETRRPFKAQRGYLWDGDALLTETSYNFDGGIVSRKDHVPGPGPDQTYQIKADGRTFSLFKDEQGNPVGLFEETSSGKANLLARFLYTPYGDLHLEAGPEPRKAEFKTAKAVLGPVTQTVDSLSVTGSLELTTTLALAATSYDALKVETFDTATSTWIDVPRAQLTIGVDTNPELLILFRTDGWKKNTRYRFRVTTGLKDDFGRNLQLPDDVAIELQIPLDITTVAPIYIRTFKLGYDTAKAAANELGGAFAGGLSLGFTGAAADPFSGLLYLRNRWYDPASGTWLSQDPLEDRDSPNLYGFVKMRPHELTDPMGLLGLADAPSIAWDTFTGIFDPRNAWTNMQRAAGGVVGAGKFAYNTAKGLAETAADVVGTAAGDTEAADRLVERGQGIKQAVTHPVDTIVKSHSDTFEKILEHEQKSEYLSSGAEAGELGVADAAAIYGGATAARSLLRAARTATARGVLQRVTTTTNARLAVNPALAQEVLSDAEYAAGQASKRVAPMQYGNALERMVAERVQESRILGSLYEHVGGPSNPDFIGRGIFKGLNLDITTPGAVQAHLARPGYGPGLLISKYQRPAGFSLFPAAP